MAEARSVVRGPLFNPSSDNSIDWFPDGAIACDADGRTTFVGDWSEIADVAPPSIVRKSDGIILPPLIDAHTHISQFAIRGHFLDGIGAHPEGGRLLAGLNRNVFPAEAHCANPEFAKNVIRDFLADTLSHGVVGGAAYMTVHPHTTRLALEILPESWLVGLVLMNCNCPENLRTDEVNLARDINELAQEFGRRLIITDRFAPVVDSPLRRTAVALSEKFGLRMQTHLNEQLAEKAFVEKVMYPDSGTYTDVYRTDGLLAREPILAHCIWMSDAELAMLAASPGALVAHCPSSNTLLGSGVMPLKKMIQFGIDYAICTDVGASPTTSLLTEAAQFLTLHGTDAAPEQSIFRITQAPAAALGLGSQLGTFAVGKPMSFIEVDAKRADLSGVGRDIIESGLLRFDRSRCAQLQPAIDELAARGLDAGPKADLLTDALKRSAQKLERAVVRVTIGGKAVWNRVSALSQFSLQKPL